MKTKIKNIVDKNINYYKVGYCKLDELFTLHSTIRTLIYNNWKYDIISDKIKEECYSELNVLFDFIMNEIINENHTRK